MATAIEIATLMFEKAYDKLPHHRVDEVMTDTLHQIRLHMGDPYVHVAIFEESILNGTSVGRLAVAIITRNLNKIGFMVSQLNADHENKPLVLNLTPLENPPDGSLGLEFKQAIDMALADSTKYYFDKCLALINVELDALKYAPSVDVPLGRCCPASAYQLLEEELVSRGFTIHEKVGDTDTHPSLPISVQIRLSTTACVRAVEEMMSKKHKFM